MVGRFLFLLWIIFSNVKVNCATSEKMIFPADLSSWCPHSSFCEEKIRNASSLKSNVYLNSSFVPCCSTCSCSAGCGRKRNCCKYEQDQFKLDEMFDTVCKQLVIYSVGIVQNLPKYHIIDKCPNRSEICSYKKTSGILSFLPVYSTDSGMLYYNKECALCHKQIDIVHLNPVLMCENQLVSYFRFQEKAKKKIINPSCFVKLTPPDGIDLTSEICNPSHINKCKPNKPSFAAYGSLCQSFNATFRTQSRRISYSNVYCHLCSLNRGVRPEIWLKTFEYCPADNSEKVSNDLPFAVFLETSMVFTEDKEHLDGSFKNPSWCKTSDRKEDCRPVFCPEGQMYRRGKCQVFGKQWYFKMLRINIKLLIPNGIKEVFRPDFNFFNDSTNTSVYLRRHGFQDSQLTLSYNLDKDNVTVRFFLAMLYYERKTVEPRSFMQMLRTSLQSNWILYLNQQKVVLKPKLNRFLRYEAKSYESTDIHLPHSLKKYFNEDTEIRVSQEQIRFLAGTKTVFELEYTKEAIFITKLFFCNVVHLLDEEFKDLTVRLSLKNSTVYLEDGEFTWVQIEDYEHRAAICLKDLQLYYTKSNAFGISYAKWSVLQREFFWATLSLYIMTMTLFFHQQII